MMKIQVSKLKPMAGYVLVEPAEKESVTASGIVVPKDTTEKPQYGTVLAIGDLTSTCCCEDKKSQVKVEIKVGDEVIYKKWGGNEVKIGETEYQFLKFEDVLAKITK